MLEKHIARNWSMLALYILNTDDDWAMNKDWENDLRYLASFYYDVSKKYCRKTTNKWSYHPKVDKMLNDPNFEQFLKEHSKKEACKYYGCTLVTLNTAIAGLGKPLEPTPKQKFKDLWDSSEEFRSDIMNLTLKQAGVKWNYNPKLLANYCQQFHIVRGKNGRKKKS